MSNEPLGLGKVLLEFSTIEVEVEGVGASKSTCDKILGLTETFSSFLATFGVAFDTGLFVGNLKSGLTSLKSDIIFGISLEMTSIASAMLLFGFKSGSWSGTKQDGHCCL